MTASSGYFKPADTAFSGLPESDMQLLYVSPQGHTRLFKGFMGERIVVFKCLKEELRGKEPYETMLHREYEIARPLRHPGICDHLAFLQHETLGSCIVLEWIDGRTLGTLLATEKPDGEKRRQLFLQLCDALAYIHHKQVLHKDIKPENILVTRVGDRIKVLDFGLADSDSMTCGHLPAGTEGYAAPEVTAGGDASVRSDIFSLGRILSQLLPEAAPVAERCTDPDAERRYPSVEAVKDAVLEATGKGTPRKRGPFVLLVTVAVAAGLLAGTVLLPERGRHKAAGKLFDKAAALVYAEADTPAPPKAEGPFTDTLDCFNGRCIVTAPDGCKGIMDTTGHLLQPPAWTTAEFLTADIALLTRDGLAYLCTADGRIFAEDTDAEALAATCTERYEGLLAADVRGWDTVLDSLDALCWTCLSKEGQTGAVRLYESVRTATEAVSGTMNRAQRQRLEEIETRFQEHRP